MNSTTELIKKLPNKFWFISFNDEQNQSDINHKKRTFYARNDANNHSSDNSDYEDSSDCEDSNYSDNNDSEDSDSFICFRNDSTSAHNGTEREISLVDSSLNRCNEKKVTFDPKLSIHELRTWKFAYKNARKGKWEQYGRDNERFKQRIDKLNDILSPLLSLQHRERVFNERFRY